MAIPSNKIELLEAIQINYERLLRDLKLVSLKKAYLKELPGHKKGSLMSVADIVAYLIGWADQVLEWNEMMAELSENETLVFPHASYKWNELGDLAEHFYDYYYHPDFERLLMALDLRVESILKMIEADSNYDLYQVLWYKNYTKGRMISLNTSSPYKNARNRVRKFLRES